jgi:predicted membrane protein
MTTMNVLEKIISLLAIIFAAGLAVSLISFPQLRQIHLLIPLSLVGFVVNVALIFIVLRDIFSRSFNDQNRKYMWIALVLLIWPSIIYYLYSYGFRPRESQRLPNDTHMSKY